MCFFSGCSKTEFQQFDAPAEGSIRVVSYNCAAPWGNFIKGTGSSARVKKFAEYINAVKPDSIGTQEMNQDWLDNLASQKREAPSGFPKHLRKKAGLRAQAVTEYVHGCSLPTKKPAKNMCI